ncbi:AAA family ATPase [Bacillus atrophaeus]|uniref:AAA family ATPase n=1 Tax=Bacillus atrophaeus TaxID=1452 RepID=UPI0022809FB3|nr:AAA family ATPase [Bacillus atrophaeus]MCY9198068.1 AAA family ATPase [Bacillus atrophaeus]
MASINRIQIKGFQSHVDSDIHLGNGLNVITGPSDSGKTSVLRAVRWVAFNEPAGEAFVNSTVGEAEVVITIDSGHIVTKRRRKGKTSYSIQQNEYDEGSLFEKSEVPEEVKALLGIRKETYGDFETALNFAYQLDAPFLISETASAGAKVLGKLAGTSAVDMAVKSVNKDTVAARSERSRATQDIERINGELLQFDGVDEAKERLEHAQYVLEQVEQNVAKLAKLKEQNEAYSAAQSLLEVAARKLDTLQIVTALTDIMKDIEKAQQQREKLLDLNQKYQRTAATVNDANTIINNLTGIPAATETLTNAIAGQEKVSLLNILYTEYTKYTILVNKSNEKLQSIGDLSELYSLLSENESRFRKLVSLHIWHEQYRTSEDTLRMAQERFGCFRYLEDAEILLKQAEVVNRQLIDIKDIHLKYLQVSHQITVSDNAFTQRSEELVSAQAELNQAFKEAGDVCPLCESPIKVAHH